MKRIPQQSEKAIPIKSFKQMLAATIAGNKVYRVEADGSVTFRRHSERQ